jgi:arsenite-transporting ATPase
MTTMKQKVCFFCIISILNWASLTVSQSVTSDDAIIDAEGHIRIKRSSSSSSSSSSPNNFDNSLESLIEAAKGDDLKFVFVGGKGGVGKTTSSSAIATLLSTVCNKRVLLVSTDPAHSLGDAWRTTFSNVPSSPIENLDVMELDPSEMMENELSTWAEYAKEFTDDGSGTGTGTGAAAASDDSILSKINSFQDWLSGIPGIDEATALSAAITHIESGKYDLIVFDTAPTGHTLKLLALPEILEQGIERLQSWQSTLWGYWDVFKGITSGAGTTQAAKRSQIREEVSQRMTDYKHSIQKVAKMLQDQDRARFVVVCIAEFLSVSETQRLLQELEKNKVRVSHIIVNQLVVQDSLSQPELTELESLAEVGNLDMSPELLKKTIHACRLTSARKNIQQKYLGVLKGYEETQEIIEGICEVPLLAEEVTGSDAIRRFAKLLVNESANDDSFAKSTAHVPVVGDIVRIAGLEKNTYLNGIDGTIVSDIDVNTGRCGVTIDFEQKVQTLALLPKNMSIVRTKAAAEQDVNDTSNHDIVQVDEKEQEPQVNDPVNTESNKPLISEQMINKAKAVLEDPEIKAMIAQEPRVKAAIEDCLDNPLNFVKYISDPELSPFLMKAMSKLK